MSIAIVMRLHKSRRASCADCGRSIPEIQGRRCEHCKPDRDALMRAERIARLAIRRAKERAGV